MRGRYSAWGRPKPVADADVEHLLDQLYGTRGDEFIATRDRFARELRVAGNRDDASTVAAQRRPTVAADAMNRIARAYATDIEELLALGPRLRDAQVASINDPSARETV